MTTEDIPSKQRPPSLKKTKTEGSHEQEVQPVVPPDLEAIRVIVASEIQAALDPIRDELATFVTETRKTRYGLHASLHRFALLIGPQFNEDEAGEEEWLEDQEEQESQGEEGANNPFPALQRRGPSLPGRCRAGLPVKEPEMLEMPPRRQEGK